MSYFRLRDCHHANLTSNGWSMMMEFKEGRKNVFLCIIIHCPTYVNERIRVSCFIVHKSFFFNKTSTHSRVKKHMYFEGESSEFHGRHEWDIFSVDELLIEIKETIDLRNTNERSKWKNARRKERFARCSQTIYVALYFILFFRFGRKHSFVRARRQRYNVKTVRKVTRISTPL